MPDLVRAAWLQSMLLHRSVTDRQGRELYQGACQSVNLPYESAQFDDFVHEASVSVSSFGLEVRRMPDPWSGRGVIALINTKGDEIAQLATHYTPAELTLIKTIIEMIFTAPYETYSVKSSSILNQAKDQKPSPLTQKAAERLIHNLASQGWLHLSPRTGMVALATRALLELQSYLKEQYPDYVLKCHECQHIVTRGLACRNGECAVRVHDKCESLAVSTGRGGQKKCPGCQEAWQPLIVGEESDQRQARRADRERNRGQDGEAEEEGEHEEEEQGFQDAQSEAEEEDEGDARTNGDQETDDADQSSRREGRRSTRKVPSTDEDSERDGEDDDEEGEDAGVVKTESRDDDDDSEDAAPAVKRRRRS